MDVAESERKNKTLIEADKTMLADSKLPTTFWAKAVNTTCYVQNRVLVTKPHNKTPYKLFLSRKLAFSFMIPFGCHVIILNTIDHLGKFDGTTDAGFFVGYSINSKAFRVFNNRTRIVEENLHIQFSENTPNIAGSAPNWLFDIDALTKSMNYKPVVAGNQSNGNAGTKACDDAGKARMETVPGKDYILLPLWTVGPLFSQSSKSSPGNGFKPSGDDEMKVITETGKEGGDLSKEGERDDQEKDDNVNSTYNVNAAGINEVNTIGGKTSIELPDDQNMSNLEDIIYSDDDEDVGAEADMNNLDAFMPVSPIPTTRIHKDHPVEQIIRDLNSAPQTRRMIKNLEEYGFVEAMQEELLQFRLQEVWTLVDLPNGKRAIGTKWVFRNKKDERGIVIKNKARLVAQGYTQEERIDYDEMDVKSRLRLEEEVYVCQPPGFEDPDFLDRVYKVEKALYGLHQAPRAWYETLLTYLLDNGFQRRKIDKTLFIRRDKGDILLVQTASKAEEDGIFISQDKYVTKILKKFGFTDVKTASTPMETQKPLLKDEDGEEVDVHLYRSMIGSLMYFTYLRPDIMFTMCACARYQINPKVSHLHAVKRIFRYLKGKPKLGICYLKDSHFDLVAYTDSDYAGESLDRKSTTGVNAARHKLNTAGLLLLLKVNAVRYNLLLLLKVNAARHKLTTAVEIAFLSKPAESEGFEQVVDFLNANPINYALTINPIIYTSCIEQFWASVKAKTVNGEVQLQALVDGKKVIITESIVRRDLQLEDAEGVDCCYKNAEFHQIVDFLSTCSINYTLIISLLPTYASYIEPVLGIRLPSKTVNSVKQIHAIVDGKAVVTALPQTSVPLDHRADKLSLRGELHCGEGYHTLAARLSCSKRQSLTHSRPGKRTYEYHDDLTDFAVPLRLRPHEFTVCSGGRVETSTKKKFGEDASKQGRNDDKTEELNLTNRADTEVIVEDKGSGEKDGSTADQVILLGPKINEIFSEMVDDFDKQDVIDLHRLVNERYETTSPEGYDLLLWGDLKTLFEPNDEDEILERSQQGLNLIS
ncbi:putative ribonuclease H-like domain-containing protein [Tanacetum coccineum]